MGKKIVSITLTVVFGAVVLALGYQLYHIISTPIKFESEQREREAAVISRIKDIRNAERQFKSKYQRFTADFDTLINFILTEEIQGERKIIDEDDSVAMAQALLKARKERRKFQNVEKSVAVIGPAGVAIHTHHIVAAFHNTNVSAAHPAIRHQSRAESE